jgi:hypothetical protein
VALDLAKEVALMLEQVQALIGRALADSKGEGLSGPALRLNALHHELKEVHESIKKDGEGAPPEGSANASDAQAASAASASDASSHDKGGWGTAFHNPTAAAPAASAKPKAPRDDRESNDGDEPNPNDDADIWNGFSKMSD